MKTLLEYIGIRSQDGKNGQSNMADQERTFIIIEVDRTFRELLRGYEKASGQDVGEIIAKALRHYLKSKYRKVLKMKDG